MEAYEHDRCDSEVIGMVNHNHYCYPTREQTRLMKEQQSIALMLKASRKQPLKESQQPEVTREQLILQLCHGLIPVCIGLTWVLGAMEGLADPLFTCFAVGICGLWSVVEWKWRKYHA